MANVLTVKDLRVHFHDAAPDRFAVDGLNLSVAEGEIIGLVGESGSGKTVTAMSISGLLPREKAQVSGSITLDGHEIFACSDQEILDILEKYGVRQCFYGHLHGGSHKLALEGLWDGIFYRLLSADYVNFQPQPVIK